MHVQRCNYFSMNMKWICVAGARQWNFIWFGIFHVSFAAQTIRASGVRMLAMQQQQRKSLLSVFYPWILLWPFGVLCQMLPCSLNSKWLILIRLKLTKWMGCRSTHIQFHFFRLAFIIHRFQSANVCARTRYMFFFFAANLRLQASRETDSCTRNDIQSWRIKFDCLREMAFGLLIIIMIIPNNK